MAVDSIRDTFHVNRIASSELTDRLTAQSYRPDIIKAVKQIREWGKWTHLQSICRRPINQGRTPIYAKSGRPCLKTRNVVELIVSKEEVDWVSESFAKSMERFWIQNEDLLMTRSGSGSIGRVSIYFGYDRPLTNEELFRISIAKPYDGAFVCAFFSSWWGERAIEQGISGSTGQLKLVQEHVSELPVILAEQEVQTYIGDKVRQAERLREQAKALESMARNLFNQELHALGYVNIAPQKAFRAFLKERLDSSYYNPQFTSVFDAEWFCKHSEPLSNFIDEGSYGILPESKTYGIGRYQLLTASDLKACNFNANAGMLVPASQVENKGLVKLNDVLLEIKGAIKQCILASSLAEGKYVNGSVFRFSVKDIPTGYLALYLASSIKQKYCLREAVNNIIQYLNLDCIRSLPVLRLKSELEKQISDDYLLSQDLLVFAYLLTTAAKFLVEALIEGKVTEDELKAAQEGLERGERDLDQEILGRLTRKGMDVAGEPPLFSNLDTLYTAIDQIEEKAEDEGLSAEASVIPSTVAKVSISRAAESGEIYASS